MPPLPPLAELLATLDAMKGLSAPRPGNLHFTLKFLGETDEALTPDIQGALSDAARPHAPFPVGLSGAGTFPARGDPRVFWAGVTEGADTLVALAASVEEHLGALGIPKESRAFTPHLTLARVKGHRVAEKVRRMATDHAATEWGEARCDRIHLVRSTLRPDGAVYTDLSEHPLRGDRSGGS